MCQVEEIEQTRYDALDLESIEKNPYCQHGPTVLFSTKKKKFYACSACRDHKVCNFYAEFNEGKAISEVKLNVWFERYKSECDAIYSEYKKLRTETERLKEKDRAFCQNCQVLLTESTRKSHDNHATISGISAEMMRKPLNRILKPIELNNSNAQFLFDDTTSEFIVNHIKEFKYDSVLCIGTPSTFEKLLGIDGVKSHLLDIDNRFMQFYDETKFSRFNMFNNHFFDGRQNYLEFLGKSENILLVIDPPYGGIVKLIANTIKCIQNDLSSIKSNKSNHTFLFYPYFMETWIETWLPNYKMLDYKVSYENQKMFSQVNENLKKGSPARIFTNIDLKKIQLPLDQGYVYCAACEKYVCKENVHCQLCNKCPSKDGGLYDHCEICNKCVKSSWNHCDKCAFCHLKSADSECSKDERFFKRKTPNLKNFSNKLIKKQKIVK